MYKICTNLWQGGIVDKLDDEINAVVSLIGDKKVITYPDRLKAIAKFPIEDGVFPGLKWLEAVVTTVDALRKANYCVYIHCMAGQSRSVMVTAAVLMKENNWHVLEALEFIGQKNSSIDPAGRFVQGLKDWQSQLRL